MGDHLANYINVQPLCRTPANPYFWANINQDRNPDLKTHSRPESPDVLCSGPVACAQDSDTAGAEGSGETLGRRDVAPGKHPVARGAPSTSGRGGAALAAAKPQPQRGARGPPGTGGRACIARGPRLATARREAASWQRLRERLNHCCRHRNDLGSVPWFC